MKIELKKGDKSATYYLVFECPKGSGVFTVAYKDAFHGGNATAAYFSRRELAEEFCQRVMEKRRGYLNGVPSVPMDYIIKAIRLPARVKERAAAKREYLKHLRAIKAE
jgi:hypothetical protein